MDRKKIEELLDKFCACALNDWAQGKEIDKQEARKAMEALREGLRGYRRPDYDSEYMPPAYVISYQLGHVYMAWKALTRLRDETDFGTRGRNSLRIVDFGAGTAVARIGAALMAAEAIENRLSIDRIDFDEVDTSGRMLGMGNLVWRAFTQGVQRNFADKALARAVNTVNYRQHNDPKTVRKDDSETWLTAFHVIYPENDDLKEEINQLYLTIDPAGGAFSCHEGNFERMRDVFPFSPIHECHKEYYPPHKGKPNGKGNYSAITQCATFNGQPSHPSVMNRVWNLSEKVRFGLKRHRWCELWRVDGGFTLSGSHFWSF